MTSDSDFDAMIQVNRYVDADLAEKIKAAVCEILKQDQIDRARKLIAAADKPEFEPIILESPVYDRVEDGRPLGVMRLNVQTRHWWDGLPGSIAICTVVTAALFILVTLTGLWSR